MREGKFNFKGNIEIPCWLIISLITLYLVFLFGNIKLFPDYFHLYEVEKSRFILRIIITVLGSIFSILFAIILLQFNISRDLLGRNAIVHFGQNKRLFGYSFLLILSILFSFITLHLIDTDLNFNYVGCVYYSSYLFVALILLVIPVSYDTFYLNKIYKQIDELIKEITYDEITNQYTSFGGYDNNDYQQLKIIENSPIYLLREIALNSVQKEDNLLIQYFLKRTSNRFILIIDSEKDRHKTGIIIEQFINIWGPIVNKAIEKNNIIVLKSFWKVAENIFLHFSEKKLPLINLEELNFFIRGYLSKLIDGDFDDVVKTGLSVIGEAIKNNLLKNCPEENKIFEIKYLFQNIKGEDIEANDDYEDDIQWEQISREYLGLFNYCLSLSIENSNNSLLISISNKLEYLLSDILIMKEIEEKKKFVFVISIYSDVFYSAKNALEKGLFQNADNLIFFDGSKLVDLLKDDKHYFKHCMSFFSEFIIWAVQTNRAGDFFIFKTKIDYFGRRIINEIDKDKRYKEAFNFLLELIEKLKNLFEKGIQNNMQKEDHNYLSLYDASLSFKKLYLKNHPEPDEIATSIEKCFNAFKYEVKVREMINSSKLYWKE